MPVSLSSSRSPDDFLYAPVTDARVESGNGVLDNKKKNPTLILNGYFTNSCMSFREVKFNVRPNGVIEVLPIIDVQQGVTCAQVATEFNISVSLREVPEGRYLVHIRSLNGQSVNRIVDL